MTGKQFNWDQAVRDTLIKINVYYMYIYIYTHMYIHTHIYTYKYTYILYFPS